MSEKLRKLTAEELLQKLDSGEVKSYMYNYNTKQDFFDTMKESMPGTG